MALFDDFRYLLSAKVSAFNFNGSFSKTFKHGTIKAIITTNFHHLLMINLIIYYPYHGSSIMPQNARLAAKNHFSEKSSASSAITINIVEHFY